jgi:hypothetical protein
MGTGTHSVNLREEKPLTTTHPMAANGWKEVIFRSALSDDAHDSG